MDRIWAATPVAMVTDPSACTEEELGGTGSFSSSFHSQGQTSRGYLCMQCCYPFSVLDLWFFYTHERTRDAFQSVEPQ